MFKTGYKSKNTLRLVEMCPTMTSFSTVVLIISKSKSNIFLDKLSHDQRGVITFTVRDSKQDITHCKCWGSKASVDEYQAMLQIGDVVDIVGAKVMALMPPAAGDQRYQPRGTLNCALVVNDGHGYVVKHKPDDVQTIERLRQLAQHPHKPLSSTLRLADVRCAVPGAPAAYVDLLVVLAAARPVRELKRKTPGRQDNSLLHCLELLVSDASCPEGMILSLWHADWIRRAQRWRPRQTLLHLIDVRVAHSTYQGCPVLSYTSCTLIYEQPLPQSPECQQLLAFATNMPLPSFDMPGPTNVDQLPAAHEIQVPMTVRQIYARAEGELQSSTSEQFTAVLYAMVTKFDIDGFSSCFSKKCKYCQRLMPQNSSECSNELCLLEFSLNCSGARYDYFFNINIQFSDQTGSLVETRLSGGIAEQLLGVSANAFQQLSEQRKSQLKWRFLLKYFETKLFIRKPNALRKQLTLSVVDMQLVQLDQLIDKIAAF
ncbi:hdm [Drosophila busckii]|uniref:Hdm n=1 Tax=Drosophila busckii TaxID=30019 RepID=A0A0M4ET20_DROBS|nr:protein hold'em [Drosophila busckii]ALC48614.1 hdm [Drosophila busckii]